MSKITILAFFGVLILAGCIDTSNEQDKKFIKAIGSALTEDGDTIALSDLHGGEWTKVCPVIEYERASTIAAIALNKRRGEVAISNTHDEVASAEYWGLVFLYPPDSAQYMRISQFYYMSGGCVSKDKAHLELEYVHDGSKRLRIISK